MVDVAEADVLLRYFMQHQLVPEAVLITHYHSDHRRYCWNLPAIFRRCRCMGRAEAQDHGVTHIVESGQIMTPHYQIQILPTGGA